MVQLEGKARKLNIDGCQKVWGIFISKILHIQRTEKSYRTHRELSNKTTNRLEGYQRRNQNWGRRNTQEVKGIR